MKVPLVTLLLSFAAAPSTNAALLPSSSELLSRVTCVDLRGVRHDLRAVRYEYDDHPGAKRGFLASVVIAIEEGHREDCSIRRLWQDYRRSEQTCFSPTKYDAAIICPEAQNDALMIVTETPDCETLIGVYRFSLNGVVSTNLPTSEMHARKCLQGSQIQRPVAQVRLDRSWGRCSLDLTATSAGPDRILLSFRALWKSCPDASLEFDIGTSQVNSIPEGWRVLPLPARWSILCAGEPSSTPSESEP